MCEGQELFLNYHELHSGKLYQVQEVDEGRSLLAVGDIVAVMTEGGTGFTTWLVLVAAHDTGYYIRYYSLQPCDNVRFVELGRVGQLRLFIH